MKIKFSLIIILLSVNCIKGQNPELKPDEWELIFLDDFNSYDTDNWRSLENFDHHGEPVVFTHNNVYVNNGNLVTKIISGEYYCPEPAVNEYECKRQYDYAIPYNYISGWAETIKCYKHGYFEARIKIPYQKGLWPAFWTFRAIDEGHHNAAEIDVFEMFGHLPPFITTTNIHLRYCETTSYDYDPNTKSCTELPNYYSDNYIGTYANIYRIYSLEWSPSKIKWFVDNNLIREIDNPGIIDPVRFILGIGVTTNPWPDESTTFPSEMNIDYFRVYGKKLTLQDDIIDIGEQKNHYASYSIDVAGSTNYIVDGNGANGGNLTLEAANSINLNPGFHAKNGAIFDAKIDNLDDYLKSESTSKKFTRGGKKDYPLSYQKNEDTETFENSSLSISPNPSNGQFTISIEGYEISNCNITITNTMGSTVYNNNVSSNITEINLGDQATGIYFARIMIDGEVITKQLVIQ